MDIKDRIIEAVVEKLISQRVDELSADTLASYISKAEAEGPHPKGSNRKVGISKAKYRLGKIKSKKNTKSSVMGSNASGNKGYKAMMSTGEKAPPDSIADINKMGVRKTHNTKTNDKAEQALAAKTAAISRKAMNSIEKMR